MSGSPNSQASETVPISNTSTLLNVNMSHITKLTASNFLMWSRQVYALLEGYDLAGYVDGSHLIPSVTVVTDGETVTNPLYTIWKRQIV